MSVFTNIPEDVENIISRSDGTSRRDFLKTSGLLVVGFSALGAAAPLQTAQGPGPYPDPNFRQLDAWIVIREDNTATFFVGKTDLGQGTGTAFRQIMCDELDMAYDRTSCVMGSTDVTPDQGGSGGSDALQVDGYPMRRVAAEARRVLLEMASARLAVPIGELSVRDGVVSVTADPSRRVTYGQLIGGRRFNVALTGGSATEAAGTARIKNVQDLRLSGQSLARYDIPPKVDGSLRWAVDVKLPGMVHARNVKPPFAGATLAAVDESSVRNLPGFVRIVRRANYLAVVCEREEQAIRAASALKATWNRPPTAPFPASENLFDYMRRATPTVSAQPPGVGTPDAAFQSAARIVEAQYEVPFQGHVSFGPAHATADPSNDQMTIYSNDMKSYGLRDGVAQFLQMPRDRVRVVWMEGSQAYGRTAADDAGFEAAFIAKEIGRPVRLQWMRQEETGWDTKAPAYVVSMRGGLDGQGNLAAYSFEARAADHNHLGYNEHDTVLVAQLAGMRKATPNRGGVATPSDMYAIPNRQQHRRTSSVCRSSGKHHFGPATCGTRMVRRSPSPPSRSSTSSPSRPAPTRSRSG